MYLGSEPSLWYSEMHMNILISLLTNPALISLLVGILLGTYTWVIFEPWLAEFIAGYLIFTIGFKGGACLGIAHACTPPLMVLTGIGVLIGFAQPFLYYILLKKVSVLDTINVAVIAAQYGSISIVTFITGVAFLHEHGMPYDTFMSALAGIMELPALVSGLWIIHYQKHNTQKGRSRVMIDIAKSIIACRKILLIFIGFFVGFLLRNQPTGTFTSVLMLPFNGILVAFMLDIGIKIAQQRVLIKQIDRALIIFAVFIPLINGILGLFIAQPFITYKGSAVLFALLLASASYIAVPAVMRAQAPEAKEAIYLPLALGITLPFNIIIGIPLLYWLAH